MQARTRTDIYHVFDRAQCNLTTLAYFVDRDKICDAVYDCPDRYANVAPRLERCIRMCSLLNTGLTKPTVPKECSKKSWT